MSKHDEVQRAILDYLNWLPSTFAWPTHDDKYRPVERGVTDISCCHRGDHYAIEVKAGKDKMRTEQDDFGRKIIEAGGVHVVVSNLDEMMAVIPRNKR